MLFYKGGNEVIAVVVTIVVAHLETEAAFRAGFLE
jgi:hypothetical protein